MVDLLGKGLSLILERAISEDGIRRSLWWVQGWKMVRAEDYLRWSERNKAVAYGRALILPLFA